MFKFIIFSIMICSVKIASCTNYKAWVDIPRSFALPRECNKGQIVNLIDSYHEIGKKNLNLILSRVTTLERIGAEIEIEKVNAPSHAKNKLKKLENIIRKKIWYLKEINNIYNNPSPYELFLDTRTGNKSFTPLILVNNIFFDLKLPAYWGLYWLEVLDPCHRFLTPHYIRWKSDNSNTPFFLWLEDQEIFYNATQIKFMPKEKLLKHQVHILDGYFFHRVTGGIVDCSDPVKEYIFVITLDESIIVMEGDESIRHSSISYGRPVLGAGAIKIQRGKLTYIDVESGHYQPMPSSLLQIINIFNKKGAKLDYNVLTVKYYYDGHTINESATEFIKNQRKWVHEKSSMDFSKNIEKFKI